MVEAKRGVEAERGDPDGARRPGGRPDRARGHFGVGAEGVFKSANIGALPRTGHAFAAAFCFTIGTGRDPRAADTAEKQPYSERPDANRARTARPEAAANKS